MDLKALKIEVRASTILLGLALGSFLLVRVLDLGTWGDSSFQVRDRVNFIAGLGIFPIAAISAAILSVILLCRRRTPQRIVEVILAAVLVFLVMRISFP